MTPTYQTNNHNCLEACICSLFDCTFKDLPQFPENEDWLLILNEWLTSKKIQAFLIDHIPLTAEYPHIYSHYLFLGEAKGIPHAVIAYNGGVVFDPNSHGKGLDNIYHDVIFLKQL